ncbi:c-type cytochrome [Methylomagnum sp.]
MKRAIQKRAIHWSLAVALLESVDTVAGQPYALRPGAAQLLEVPVSGNPIGDRPGPDIKNPFGHDPNAIVQGEKLFAAMNCNGCHAPLGGGGMGPSLSDGEWIYGGTSATIYLSIHQGRPNGMPSWGRSLPPEAIWNLVAYIETLGKAPPPPEPGAPEKPAHPAPSALSPLGLPP